MTDERESLRATFDAAADAYHAARPRYPVALFDRLHEVARLTAPADMLEVGPATGIATEPMAARGHRIVAIELGEDLARHCARNLSAHPHVRVEHASFDSWQPPTWQAFDLVFAATAWHWLDPSTRYERAARHLRSGGSLAFWSANHVVPDGGDPIFADLQPVYDEIGESLPSDAVFPRPGELAESAAEIEATGLFSVELVQHFDWEIVYSATGYKRLLDTFSGHIAMGPVKRARLDEAIDELVNQRPAGTLRRHWGCVLHVARKR